MTRTRMAATKANSLLQLIRMPLRPRRVPISRARVALPLRNFSTSWRCAEDKWKSQVELEKLAKRREKWREQLEIPSGLQATCLYDLHVNHGAKMVPFGGHHMPLQYPSQSIVDSHHFTRTHASLFDVSHMVQHRFAGKHAASFLEKITPSGIKSMAVGQSQLSTFLWPETGGIVDDTMITRVGSKAFDVVTNAGTREKVLKYLLEQTKELQKPPYEDFFWSLRSGRGLVALQGPQSAEILQEFVPSIDLSKLYFGQNVSTDLRYVRNLRSEWYYKGVEITRGGYTGEDGFEISFKDTPAAILVVEQLLKRAGPEKLQLAGLGVRDSLRLEAGMCLYGHDLDDTTTPVEAGLSWIIPPERRKEGGFHGADIICKQLIPKSKGGLGVERRRVGFIVEGAPAREGAEIHTKEGEKIGVVTSGAPSPTLGKNIAMGYVKDGYHKSGTELDILVRGKKRAATVTKMPFVPSKYFKAPAPAPA